ncbi:MAG: hypothetical protein AUG89_08585 [Acidobacteria bacterium 13_1_20CM_4_56_7]|nr:MAG: hypothetical protein AUG89_08585 [Acidobacteria bacterium 13_1_20CM_4_56_7]
MCELLTTQGFKVITAVDGAEALEQMSRVPTDLVLLDVMMPELSGFDVCAKLKSNPDTYLIPVILVTALSDKENRIEGIRVEFCLVLHEVSKAKIRIRTVTASAWQNIRPF